MPDKKRCLCLHKKVKNSFELFTFCDSRGIQTHNLLIRSQMLYSVELGSLISEIACKGTHFLWNRQIFQQLFSKKVQKGKDFTPKGYLFPLRMT